MKTSKTSVSGIGWRDILLITACLVFSLAALRGAAWFAAFVENAATTTTTEHQSKDWRPDISKCPESVELWNCIQGALYARREP